MPTNLILIFFIFPVRFIEEEAIQKPKLLVIVGCIGLLVNIIGLVLLHGKSESDCSLRTLNSINVNAIFGWIGQNMAVVMAIRMDYPEITTNYLISETAPTTTRTTRLCTRIR